MAMLPPAPLRIRQARTEDQAALLDLVARCLSEYGLRIEPGATDACLADVAKSYLKPGGRFEVLCDKEQHIVGSYGLMPVREGVCELRKMYLDCRFRGQGLGKWLLNRALAEAKRLGFRRIELETASVLVEAVGLYRTYGFRPITRPSIPSRCDSAMALDLDWGQSPPSKP